MIANANSFAGTGASTTVTSVRIENLVQGTSREISGTDILHLTQTLTGIKPVLDKKDKIRWLWAPGGAKQSRVGANN